MGTPFDGFLDVWASVMDYPAQVRKDGLGKPRSSGKVTVNARIEGRHKNWNTF